MPFSRPCLNTPKHSIRWANSARNTKPKRLQRTELQTPVCRISQGQKDFPQNILLKRQRSLQDAMEKSLKFRHDIDSILVCAETEALAPVRKRLDDAIKAVGLEHGYEYIINTDANAYPFIHHAVAEDATTYVKGKLK